MHDLITLETRLAYVRHERAYERRASHGLTPSRSEFLSGICSVLAAEVEQAGLVHLDQVLPPGEAHDLGAELVALAAAGLGYEGIALHLDEVRVIASRFAHARAQENDGWRGDDQAEAIVRAAYRALFVPASFSTTVAPWPAWLPLSIARPCVALLHRRTRASFADD